MTQPVLKRPALTVIYPDWNSLIGALVSGFGKTRQLHPQVVKKLTQSYARKIKIVQEQIQTELPVVAIGELMQGEGYYVSESDIQSVLEKVRATRLGQNEFYVVYDALERRFIYVDPAVNDVLGISESEFNLPALLGLHPEYNLSLPEDAAHKIRWAGIAYLILSLPGFTFTSLRDHYRVSVRIDTSRSRRPDLAEAGTALLTKQCYFVITESEEPSSFPRYHINRVNVYDSARFSYVHPHFDSDFIQGKYLNALAYLINASLIGIDPKFILMLDEKSRQERNKAVAESLNKKIETHTQLQKRYTENQVADCFAKTIRPKIESAINSWVKPAKAIRIESDSDAVEFARQLGLLPVNELVMQLILRNAEERF